jgi:hypothetical protein
VAELIEAHDLTAASQDVESPATRGTVVISIWFDPADDGNLRQHVSYERAAG